MLRRIVKSKNAPAAIGAYSQAVVSNGFVFTSGQIAIDKATGKMVEQDIEKQTIKVLENLEHILNAADTSLSNAVLVNIYLKNLEHFNLVNEIYSLRVDKNAPPARVTIEASKLPKDALIEVSAIAVVNKGIL